MHSRAGRQKDIVASFAKSFLIDIRFDSRPGKPYDDDGSLTGIQPDIFTTGQGKPITANLLFIKQHSKRREIDRGIHQMPGLMRQLDIDRMKRDLILIPNPMDPRCIRKILIPEVFRTKRPVTGFDYRLRACPRIPKDQKYGRGGMPVKKRRVSRWDAHIQDPHPSVVQDIMMSWLVSYLYHFRSICRELGKTAAGKKKGRRNKEGKAAHSCFFIKIRINYAFDCVSFF